MKKYLLLLPSIIVLFKLPAQSTTGVNASRSGQYQLTGYYYIGKPLNTWELIDSAKYFYNAAGEMDYELDWDTSGNIWDTSERVIYTYDNNGNQLSELDQDWAFYQDTFRQGVLYTYQFNINSDETFYLQQNWDTISNTWLNYRNDLLLYDNNYRLLSDTTFQWNDTFSRWDYYTLYTYHYNGAGLTDTSWYFGSGLQRIYQTIYGYDTLGNNSYQLTQQWNVDSDNYINFYSNAHTFNSAGQVTVDIYSNWYSNTDSIRDIRELLNYTANGKPSSSVEQLWNQGTNEWQNATLTDFISYTAFDSILELSDYFWDRTTSTWDLSAQYNYFYDINNNLSTKLYYVVEDDTLQLNSIQYYYYTLVAVSGLSEPKNDLQPGIFPNPASEIIHFEFHLDEAAPIEMDIFDDCGRRLLVQNSYGNAGNNDISIPVANLPAGEYFLSAADRISGKSTTLKWIKD